MTTNIEYFTEDLKYCLENNMEGSITFNIELSINYDKFIFDITNIHANDVDIFVNSIEDLNSEDRENILELANKYLNDKSYDLKCDVENKF